MTIPDPPSKAACGSCMDPLLWLYSPRTSAWVAFVADAVEPTTLHLHRCQHAQDPVTWRTLQFRAPGSQSVINRRGRARVEALLKIEERTEEEN